MRVVSKCSNGQGKRDKIESIDDNACIYAGVVGLDKEKSVRVYRVGFRCQFT